jgi:hypothetical protein
MPMRRTFDGKVYSLRVIDRECCEPDSRLNSSFFYAMQRHHETGRPYLIGWYGHVILDCQENRKLLKSEEFGGVAAATKAL